MHNMNKYTICDVEEAREVADKVVTLMQSVSELKARQEAEKNALDRRFAAQLAAVEGEAQALQRALQAFLRRAENQEALFDAGARSGRSALARFGYRDAPRALTALRGRTADVARALWEAGERRFVRAAEPRLSLDAAAVARAQLSDGQLADLGLMWSTKTRFFIEPLNREITRPASSQV